MGRGQVRDRVPSFFPLRGRRGRDQGRGRRPRGSTSRGRPRPGPPTQRLGVANLDPLALVPAGPPARPWAEKADGHPVHAQSRAPRAHPPPRPRAPRRTSAQQRPLRKEQGPRASHGRVTQTNFAPTPFPSCLRSTLVPPPPPLLPLGLSRASRTGRWRRAATSP